MSILNKRNVVSHSCLVMAEYAKQYSGYIKVIGHAMTTVLTLNDSAKMNRQKIRTSRVCHPSQKQKRSNVTHKPTLSCFTFAFAQPHKYIHLQTAKQF